MLNTSIRAGTIVKCYIFGVTMKFSKFQENEITRSIDKLNELTPISDQRYKEYESAKFKGGLVIIFGFLVIIATLSGNNEVHKSIGTLGVGASPFLFLGGFAYIWNVRQKYHKAISVYTKYEQPLLAFGLAYIPASSYNKESRLIVIETNDEFHFKKPTGSKKT
ncbi:hypothetical protein CWN98_21120 [Vibrio splendidus]|uniref:Uncharacterized protein n=1 Tax=Vibrio splendidus TaxID=29497 RepID=A0A0H3ZL32_VIBSP|nr:hypothetical protein [Vibrio splendidus]AKN36735.1 hypothetical protein [Vibrio splendidus]PTO81608.1 hypothetical protein CWN98_21120 [Vibrio splendidus]PTP45799.1 hypothetical protein CWO10_16075 [Vibrio splendidus]